MADFVPTRRSSPITANQSIHSSYEKRGLKWNSIILLIIYSFVMLLIGRNLSFIPKFDFRSEEKKTNDLKDAVIRLIRNKELKFSLYYKDLKTNDEFGIDEHKVLTGASLNKLVIVSYLYSLASKNKIELDEKIVLQEEDIQDYGTGSLRYEEPGQTFSLRTLAELSLRKSDNSAAHILSVKLGAQDIQKYANALGLSATSMDDNKTTAADMGEILSLLYKGKIVPSPLKEELLDYLTNTDFEDRLPKNLPKNVNVFHKSGDALNLVHDVGIVDDGKKPFVLTVMTHDVSDENEAKESIAEIARLIYSSKNER